MTVYINGTTGLSGVDGSASTPALQGADTNTGISFGTDTVTINTGGVARVTTDSSGNVGIGTDTPGTKLQIKQTTDDTIGGLGIVSVDGTKASAISELNDGALTFRNTGSERMRIDSSGNLLVNTTALQQDGKLSIVFNPSSNRGISIRTTSDTSANPIAFVNAGNSIVGTITTDASTTNYATSSDYRLKESITPMTGALARNDLLNPVTYKWKVDGSDGQGFIAHELQNVFPDAVTGEKDAVDAEGNPQYQGVDTSFLVGHLVACVKELKSELDSVKAELATLKAGE